MADIIQMKPLDGGVGKECRASSRTAGRGRSPIRSRQEAGALTRHAGWPGVSRIRGGVPNSNSGSQAGKMAVAIKGRLVQNMIVAACEHGVGSCYPEENERPCGGHREPPGLSGSPSVSAAEQRTRGRPGHGASLPNTHRGTGDLWALRPAPASIGSCGGAVPIGYRYDQRATPA